MHKYIFAIRYIDGMPCIDLFFSTEGKTEADISTIVSSLMLRLRFNSDMHPYPLFIDTGHIELSADALESAIKEKMIQGIEVFDRFLKENQLA